MGSGSWKGKWGYYRDTEVLRGWVLEESQGHIIPGGCYGVWVLEGTVGTLWGHRLQWEILGSRSWKAHGGTIGTLNLGRDYLVSGSWKGYGDTSETQNALGLRVWVLEGTWGHFGGTEFEGNFGGLGPGWAVGTLQGHRTQWGIIWDPGPGRDKGTLWGHRT